MSKLAENPAVVLVVNDDRVACDLITEMLEPQGYKIISATNAHQALEITSARRTDVIIINEAGARFFGLPASELIGQPLGALIGEDIASLDTEKLRNLKSSGPVRFTPCLKNALGEERYLEGIVTLEQDSTAKPIGIRAVVRDVTERQRGEDALKKQSDKYRLLFDSNPCPMYVADESTLRFLAVNDAAINHYGYSREEFLSMTALEIRPEEEVPALMEYVEKAMSANQEAAVVWKHRKKDGALIDVEV